ncbi:MAG TPA: hypothetical protein VGM32_19600 [Rhodopila sp.]
MRHAVLSAVTAATLLVLGSFGASADPAFLYVSTASPSVDAFTSNGTGSLYDTIGLNGPAGIALDKKGNLFAADYNTNTIGEIGPNGTASVFASSSLRGPFGLVFDSAGNLCASNATANTIVKFSPSGAGALFASTGLGHPLGLAFDGAGNVYAGNATITRLRNSPRTGQGQPS